MKTPDEIKKGLECCKPVWKGDHWKNCDEKCPYSAEASFCKTVLNGDTRALIQQLEAQVPKWISVKDVQKPKHGERVLCTYVFYGCPERYVGALNYYAYGDNGYVTGAHFSDEGMYDMRVTHWMPLPEPPKEENE